MSIDIGYNGTRFTETEYNTIMNVCAFIHGKYQLAEKGINLDGMKRVVIKRANEDLNFDIMRSEAEIIKEESDNTRRYVIDFEEMKRDIEQLEDADKNNNVH